MAASEHFLAAASVYWRYYMISNNDDDNDDDELFFKKWLADKSVLRLSSHGSNYFVFSPSESFDLLPPIFEFVQILNGKSKFLH